MGTNVEKCWKDAYPTLKDAREELKRRDENKYNIGGKYWKKRIYFCPDCGNYHFTTIENKEKLYKKTSGEVYIRKTYNRAVSKNNEKVIYKSSLCYGDDGMLTIMPRKGAPIKIK